MTSPNLGQHSSRLTLIKTGGKGGHTLHLITSDLPWNDQISKMVGLASHRLRFIQSVFRNCPETVKETGYTTLVCPLLEYCAPVWSPHLVTQILAVEMVQHRAARFVKGNFQWTANVTEMLRSLHWDTLRSRRENLSLGLFKRFSLTCNSNLIINIFRANPRTQRCHAHSKPMIEIRAKQDCYYWSFFLSSIRQWNILPINNSDLLGIQFNNDV